jgi:hypothetical protein
LCIDHEEREAKKKYIKVHNRSRNVEKKERERKGKARDVQEDYKN